MELEHPTLELRQGARLVAAGRETALHPAAQPLVLVVHLSVDARTQVADRAHLTPLVGQAEYAAANDALARAIGQHLEEIHPLGIHVNSQIGQRTVETPAAPLLLG